MMKVIKGKKIEEIDKKALNGKISNYKKIIVDIGTGDGKFIYNLAKKNPENLYIGIDASESELEKVSAKIYKKESRGGLENAMYIKAYAEDLPNGLNNLADKIYINFPWGSLLEGVVTADKKLFNEIKRIFRSEDGGYQQMCHGERSQTIDIGKSLQSFNSLNTGNISVQDGADIISYKNQNTISKLQILLTYNPKFENKYIQERELPKLSLDYLQNNWKERIEKFGIKIDKIKTLNSEEKKDIPTSWGKQILSERDREVYKIDASITSECIADENVAQVIDDRLTYTFSCFGHPNIKATHVKTIEFTKDREITERGDCIIGIKADFELEELRKFFDVKKIKIICTLGNLKSIFKCKVNSGFASEDELVCRKSGFLSDRTFGLGLNRGANRLDRKIVELLQDKVTEMKVTILEGWW